MRSVFKMNADQLDENWIELIKAMFEDEEIEIVVRSSDEYEEEDLLDWEEEEETSSYAVKHIEIHGDVEELNILSPEYEYD